MSVKEDVVVIATKDKEKLFLDPKVVDAIVRYGRSLKSVTGEPFPFYTVVFDDLNLEVYSYVTPRSNGGYHISSIFVYVDGVEHELTDESVKSLLKN